MEEHKSRLDTGFTILFSKSSMLSRNVDKWILGKDYVSFESYCTEMREGALRISLSRRQENIRMLEDRIGTD
ncbi:hypothetical protein J6590_021569 [Homalodisca vitripennis]|nr:hypothetical protein J6590_021569 [Homalodisca vitripennis]